MEKRSILSYARKYARDELQDDSTGHDWWHALRVSRMALKIAETTGADAFVCEMAALLHDIPDEKRGVMVEKEAAALGKWMMEIGVDGISIDHIQEIISTMSFRGGGKPPMRTPEGEAVQDADRLDAIGAIGIARAFIFSGHTGRPMHDPESPPRLSMSEEEYRRREGTAINHFYEKLLRLPELLNTDPARKIAEHRMAVMEDFLEEFAGEWDGER